MSRQAIAVGVNGPVYVNETSTRQAIVAPGVYVDETVSTAVAALPFNQFDWPVPTQPFRGERTWIWSFAQTLIGGDVLPFRTEDGRLPAQPFRPERTWLWQYVANLTGRDTIPFRTDDGRLPAPLPRAAIPWTFSFQVTLTGKDTLPFQTQDGRLTTAMITPAPLNVTYLTTNSILLFPPSSAVTLPFNQYDWPLPFTWPTSLSRSYTIPPGILLLPPPVVIGQYTVSGLDVMDLFPTVTGVDYNQHQSLPWSFITKRTN